MSLRTRLIIAFLLMSVLPLAAVTGYGYYSSRQAMQRAVEAEAGATATQLGRRMELVTDDLERRMEKIWDVRRARIEGAPEEPAPVDPAVAGTTAVAGLLGDAATWLDQLELVPTVRAAEVPGQSVPKPATGRPVRPIPPPPPPVVGHPPASAPAPPAPPPIVIDLNAVIAEATKNDPDAQAAAAMAKRLLDRLQIDINPALTAGIQGTAEGLRRGAEELARIAEQRQTANADHRRIVTERKGGHLGFRVMRDGE